MGDIHIIDHNYQPFSDRSEAGYLLGRYLRSTGLVRENTVVLGIPRGGIIVAREIARTVAADLNIVLARKIGAPGNPELAIGAVTEDGRLFLHPVLVKKLGVSETYIQAEKKRHLQEISRRAELIRHILPALPLSGRDVIIVDDGIATGATMQAGLLAVEGEAPSRLTCAIPVAPEDTLTDLAQEADNVVCYRSPPGFAAVGQFYLNFPQIEDEEVLAIMREEAARKGISGEKSEL
jgi:putative phosphoribosyl transferase